MPAGRKRSVVARERKKKEAARKYARAWSIWCSQEPPKWRIIQYYRWLLAEPKERYL